MAGNGGAASGAAGTTSTGGVASGGSAGSSGNGGSGGGAPHTVGNCDDLAPAGQWESLWPLDPSGGTYATALAIDPFDSGTVWATATDQGVFKSTDCGSHWTHVSTGEGGQGVDSVNHGGIPSLALDPVTPGTIYVAPIYGPGGVWKSTNFGVDFVNLTPWGSDVANTVEANFMDSVSMDPSDHLHLVVGTHANCKAPYDPACQIETTDGGETWKIVKIPGGGWQEQAGPFVINQTSWIYGAPGGLWLTTDHGDTWKDVNPGGLAFGGGEVENQGIQIGKDGTYYISSYSGVVTSSDAVSWSLIPNSGGRTVGLTMGNNKIFTSDQWSTSFHWASEDDTTTWTVIPPPAVEELPSDQGAPFIDYDVDHKVLYTAHFAGGIFRVVLE